MRGIYKSEEGEEEDGRGQEGYSSISTLLLLFFQFLDFEQHSLK